MNYEAVVLGGEDGAVRLGELVRGELAVIVRHPVPGYCGQAVLATGCNEGTSTAAVNLMTGYFWPAPSKNSDIWVRRLRPGEVVELRAK